ncbi:hypothetical protein J6590_073381 [Homalodisca vitripennis]|nr:hypothetical protein J6590_073381 [Homalodisca vitripennis]
MEKVFDQYDPSRTILYHETIRYSQSGQMTTIDLDSAGEVSCVRVGKGRGIIRSATNVRELRVGIVNQSKQSDRYLSGSEPTLI